MRRHAPHASAMGKRDAGSDAPAKVSLLSFLSYRIMFDEINHQSFRPVVLLCEFGGSHMRKLLFFHSPWCPPCRFYEKEFIFPLIRMAGADKVQKVNAQEL